MGAVKGPLATIREHCLDCANGSPKEVEFCPVTRCKLYQYRLGVNPNRTKRVLSEERKEALLAGLAKARQKKVTE